MPPPPPQALAMDHKVTMNLHELLGLKVPAQGWYELQSAQNQNKVLQGFVEGKVKHMVEGGARGGRTGGGSFGVVSGGCPWESGGRTGWCWGSDKRKEEEVWRLRQRLKEQAMELLRVKQQQEEEEAQTGLVEEATLLPYWR